MRRQIIAGLFLIAVAHAAFVQKIYDNDQCSGDYIGYSTYPDDATAPLCENSCTSITTGVYAVDICGQEFANTVPGFGEFDFYSDSTCSTLLAKLAGKPNTCVSTTAAGGGVLTTYQFDSACDGVEASFYLYYGDATCTSLLSSQNATTECISVGRTWTKAPTCSIVVPVAPPMTPVAPPMTAPVASAPITAPVAAPKAAPVATPVKKTSNAAAFELTAVSVIVTIVAAF